MAFQVLLDITIQNSQGQNCKMDRNCILSKFKHIMFEELTVPFNKNDNRQFLERVDKSDNYKLKRLLEQLDTTMGSRCSDCNEVLPFYRYHQEKRRTYGIEFGTCTYCKSQRTCPYRRMYHSTKKRCLKEFGIEPDFDIEFLKQMYLNQKGMVCDIIPMLEEYGTGNPFNMSVERIDNTLPYTKNNIMLICVFMQTNRDLKIEDWKKILLYNAEHDEFIFDKETFLSESSKQLTKQRTGISTQVKRDSRGSIVSKVCTDCNIRKDIEYFSYKNKVKDIRKSFCKECDSIRNINARNTVRGFITQMKNAAISNSKKRSKVISRNDSSHVVAPDLFEIIIELIILQGGRCNYTGIPLVFKLNHTYSASLDRIDNSKGYIRGNLQVIIVSLNTPKKMSKEEFLKMRDSIQYHS